MIYSLEGHEINHVTWTFSSSEGFDPAVFLAASCFQEAACNTGTGSFFLLPFLIVCLLHPRCWIYNIYILNSLYNKQYIHICIYIHNITAPSAHGCVIFQQLQDSDQLIPGRTSINFLHPVISFFPYFMYTRLCRKLSHTMRLFMFHRSAKHLLATETACLCLQKAKHCQVRL